MECRIWKQEKGRKSGKSGKKWKRESEVWKKRNGEKSGKSGKSGKSIKAEKSRSIKGGNLGI